MSIRHLEYIQEEAYSRMFSFFDEVHRIREYFQNNGITLSLDDIDNIYSYNNKTITNFNEYIRHNTNFSKTATYPFKTHKLLEIFDCALNYAHNHFDDLVNFDEAPYCQTNERVVVDFGSEFIGNSKPNCIFNIYASVYYNKTGIYDLIHPQISSMVQTTKMPVGFDVDSFSQDFKNSMYYYKDEYSPKQGELLFTHYGYSFGGSREDERYDNKAFKTYDCSSYVSSILGSSKSFSTSHMEQAFNNQCGEDSYCLSVADVLKNKQVNSLDGVDPGDVFVVRTSSGGGHTGFVNQVFNNSCYEEISFNRDMPKVEGVCLMTRCIGSVKNIYFFETVD